MPRKLSPGKQSFSHSEREAMRLVEGMLDAGRIELAPDKWNQGRLRFMFPEQAARAREYYAPPPRKPLLARIWSAVRS